MRKSATDIRVLIADDHRLFREGLRNLLDAQPDFRVVGEASDGREVLRLVERLKPDVLLLNPRMPNISGMEILRSLPPSAERSRTIFLTADSDMNEVSEAFRFGARGIIPEESDLTSLFQCIRAVAAGQYWVIREALATFPKPDEGRPDLKRKGWDFSLTGRELEVVAAVILGKTNREIAEQFSISEQTVKHHISNIFEKCGVYNRLELSLFAIRNQLLDCIPTEKARANNGSRSSTSAA